jgi:gamma-glutamyltranspeptidase / glutathione hydrolase
MRLNTVLSPVIHDHPKCRHLWRQFAASLATVTLLAGCGPDEELRGTIGYVEGFLGGVAADEPRAAQIGRDVLSAGGNAVDAAVATYFALSVTLPSSASLGGGGVCVVHDRETKNTEALEFLARAPARVASGATRPSAVPGNPRGFFVLHAKYGGLRWERLIAPAENLARFDVRVSRALARDMAKVGKALLADGQSRRIFGRPDGADLIGEGEPLRQVELAAVLGRLRTKGPGDLYIGTLAKRLAAAVNKAGGSLNIDDLRHYSPAWNETVKVSSDNETAHFAPPPAAAGTVAARMWQALIGNEGYEDAADDERDHLFAEVALRAFADRGQWLGADGTSTVPVGELTGEARLEAMMAGYRPDAHVAAERLNPAPVARRENPAATSFVVVDPRGSAVACALTMNNLFGTGRVAPGTGILLAALPGRGGRGPTSLGPMLMVNDRTSRFFLAMAASGGVTAPTAMLNVGVRVLADDMPLDQAMHAKRLHHGGLPDRIYHEKGFDEAALGTLTGRGHHVAATRVLGLVNAAYCSEGIPGRPDTCVIRADPRGFGLAASAE